MADEPEPTEEQVRASVEDAIRKLTDDGPAPTGDGGGSKPEKPSSRQSQKPEDGIVGPHDE